MQIYIAVILQVINISLIHFLRPYEEESQNKLEIFFTFMTVSLISLCSIYTQDNLNESISDLGVDIFIYTFIAMMGFIILTLVYPSLVSCYEKLKNRKKKKQKTSHSILKVKSVDKVLS